jgi:hypothetical protein
MASPSFSATFGEIAAKAPETGASIAALSDALDRRSFGALAVVLGIVVLLPIPFVVPQLAGLMLILTGLNLIGGARAPATLRALKSAVRKPRLDAIASLLRGAIGWLENLWRGAWGELLDHFALAAGLALALAGLAALAGPSAGIGLSTLILGYGLMQRDGVLALIGGALCFGTSAFVLTMLGGVIAGAPYADAWGAVHAPWLVQWLHPAPNDLIPANHATP